jgi:hypothetical protein
MVTEANARIRMLRKMRGLAAQVILVKMIHRPDTDGTCVECADEQFPCQLRRAMTAARNAARAGTTDPNDAAQAALDSWGNIPAYIQRGLVDQLELTEEAAG